MACDGSSCVIVLFQITLIMAFAFGRWPPDALNVYFAGVILCVCGSHVVMVSLCVCFDLSLIFSHLVGILSSSCYIRF